MVYFIALSTAVLNIIIIIYYRQKYDINIQKNIGTFVN